ncbi:hypothetical protein ACIBK8_28860 [Streptomyces sp. NPDC050161]|uniref:hypothetical protein n=1 Tax=Streptomyces sp. NPDC050161 TaxID=3365604 RepID=UPI0037AE553D
MGIESDKLVFDYLSRVGDLAQQRGLSSAARMRLVATLRTDLTAQLAAQKTISVSSVKRVISRLGTPEAVVSAAAGATGAAGGAGGTGAADEDRTPAPPVTLTPPAPPTPEPPEPTPHDTAASSAASSAATSPADHPAPEPSPRPTAAEPTPRPGVRDRLSGLAARSGLTGSVPAPRDGDRPVPEGGLAPKLSFLKKAAKPTAEQAGDTAGPRFTLPPAASPPPHLAGADELGDDDGPDWWRVQAAPFGPGESVPGFVGGIEIPEIWERPKDGAPSKDGKPAPEDDTTDAQPPAAKPPLPGILRRTLTRKSGAPAAEPTTDAAQDTSPAARIRLSPVITLAVLLLLVGAVLGSWLALAAGWALAYVSRRLTRTEAKFAALGVPGILIGGMLIWLWGRMDGRWGTPITPGQLGHELLDALPTMVRIAAVASSLFLLWRMRRTTP